MQVQIIFTFDNAPQQFSTIEMPNVYLDSKKVFFWAITNQLTKDEKETLVKLSCCVSPNSAYLLKELSWYKKCNGKYWDNEIVKFMKEIYNIVCLFTPVN